MSRLYRRNRDLSQPLERVEIVVEKPDEGRFDTFLARMLTWRSRTGVQLLIEEGKALLNGARRKPSTRIRAGDRVVVEVARPPRESPAPEPELRSLFEDEWILALEKPAGVVVHPVGAHQEGTLLQALHRATGGRGKLIHRIDQYTSGALLVAKEDEARRLFSDMLERGEVEKEYEALALGVAAFDEREVSEPIGPVLDSRILMRVDRERGKPARSLFRTKERFPFASWFRVRIFTGRTHQIRVHAAALGHPLLADHLYGDGLPIGDPPVLEHFALHAALVAFTHPFTGARVAIEAPPPPPFLRAVAALRGR